MPRAARKLEGGYLRLPPRTRQPRAGLIVFQTRARARLLPDPKRPMQSARFPQGLAALGQGLGRLAGGNHH